MALDDDSAAELFREFGPVRCRRMFGGVGVFRDGLMFALETRAGVLHLKAAAEDEDAFRAEGSEAFSHTSADGRRFTMSYWRVPDRLLDDPDELAAWARRAFRAAASAPSSKRRARSG